MKRILTIILSLAAALTAAAQDLPLSGATETTPSKAQYFSWINHSWEGTTEAQTAANLDFFRWLKDTYGMQLDIYALDAGVVDGWKFYGSMDSDRFKKNFPNRFDILSRKASEMGTSLGLWAGPDGFGNTPEEAARRTDMMVGLVRDNGFRLFKLDLCCGNLRKESYPYFESMISQVRGIAPDLVLLNHRIDLGACTKYATTFLLGGAETYIDVHMVNSGTATHNRVCALERKNPDNLTRLTEDHGVCLSSCLDYWEDDLILQGFNRNLILAPEIYANPWFLRDDEYSYLAYIYNLHRDYRDILAQSATRLPESQYGPEAISRGDGSTRFISLRNLTWNEATYTIDLDETAGLEKSTGKVRVRLYHPYIYDMGTHTYGSTVQVKVPAFRSALVKITTEAETDNILVSGVPYRIINDRAGNGQEIQLLGERGRQYRYTVSRKTSKGRATTNGKVTFPGNAFTQDYHRKISDMQICETPKDISAIYYATCFAADNNALEVRSIRRSGETSVPEVAAARDAFFNSEMFRARGAWDRYLFDGDPDTDFTVSFQYGDRRRNGQSALMLDFGESVEIDRLNIATYDESSLYPLKSFFGHTAFVSEDLTGWKPVHFIPGVSSDIDLSKAGRIRYVMIDDCPLRLTEISGFKGGKELDRSKWRASNLFQSLGHENCQITDVWNSEFTLDEIPAGSYLCVAIDGKHGVEGAFAGFKIDGKYVGCADRAPSFQCNPWECPVRTVETGYTYFLPLTEDMVGKKIEAFVMGLGDKDEHKDLRPEVWITSYPIPFETKTLTFQAD